MKGAAAWALALALAAAAQQPPPPPGAGAVPDSVRRLARDLARFGGCFAQRAWDDAQHVDCAAAAARRPAPTLAACVCAHRAQLARQLRRSFDVCVDSGAAYAAIIRQVGADVGAVGLCSAYAGGRFHHHHSTHRPAPGRPDPAFVPYRLLPEPARPGP